MIANDRAYEAAYAKGDAEALADFFSEDAEDTAEDGRIFKGRAEIEEGIRAALVARKGGSLAIDVETVHMLAPEVLLEEGATTVTTSDGEVSESLYCDPYEEGGGMEDQSTRCVAHADEGSAPAAC